MADTALSALELQNLAHQNTLSRERAKEKAGKVRRQKDVAQAARNLRQAELDLEANRAEGILVSGRLFI